MAGAVEPTLTVAAVARRLGIAPATLRTWDRRYGLGPSDHVVRPVLAAITHRWAHAPDAAIETEHLLYECVLAALIRATPLVTEPCNPRPVLLAGAPGDQHTLPLYGPVATLAARGVGTRMLGPALPADALAAAIRRLAPAVVVVWAQLPAHAEPARIRHRRARLFLGGPGWYGVAPEFVLADGMESAASEIVGVVR